MPLARQVGLAAVDEIVFKRRGEKENINNYTVRSFKLHKYVFTQNIALVEKLILA